MPATARSIVEQIVVLAEYGTTGPERGCKSHKLTAAQATSLRSAISQLAREALVKLPAGRGAESAVMAVNQGPHHVQGQLRSQVD
jgi:hypothetical protein